MSELLDFSGRPILVSIAIFAVGAAVVSIAGTRMVRLVDQLARRTNMWSAP